MSPDVDRAPQLETLVTVRSHTSSVRALAFNSDQSLLFSAGGRAQLKAWSVHVDACGVASMVERANHMLRARERRPWRAARPAADPETRYMYLCCLPDDGNYGNDSVVVAAACSDGLLRFFSYCDSSRSLTLALECWYHDRCLLTVSCLPPLGNQHIVMTTATDGQCAFWAISLLPVTAPATSGSLPLPGVVVVFGQSTPFATLRLHQSGVNSLAWTAIGRDTFVLVTGGDDNAMVLTLVDVQRHLKLAVAKLAQIRLESSHAAQITGLKFHDGWLVSACIDQRLRVWRWNVLPGVAPVLACVLAGQYTTTVSDIQGLQVWTNRDSLSACVHGKGLEVIDIELS